MTSCRLPFAIVALGLSTALAAAPAAESTVQRQVYVTAVGSNGAPVTGLPPSAFHVREGGIERRVVDAGPATGPLDVALVPYSVENYQTEAQDVRKTIDGLVDAFGRAGAGTRLALVTSIAPPTFVGIPAGDATLRQTLTTFFVSPQGFSLFEAIDGACRAMKTASSPRRAVFVIANLAGAGERGEARQVVQALDDAGASLWALEYSAAFAPQADGGEATGVDPQKEQLLSAGTLLTGGDHDTVIGTAALSGAATRLATLLLSQYAVTYQAPAGDVGQSLELGVAWPGVKTVLGPHTPPRRLPAW